MTHIQKMKKVARIIKKQFPDTDDLTAIGVAYKILEAVEEPPADKVTNVGA